MQRSSPFTILWLNVRHNSFAISWNFKSFDSATNILYTNMGSLYLLQLATRDLTAMDWCVMAGDDDEKCSNNNLTTQFEREVVSRVTFECRIQMRINVNLLLEPKFGEFASAENLIKINSNEIWFMVSRLMTSQLDSGSGFAGVYSIHSVVVHQNHHSIVQSNALVIVWTIRCYDRFGTEKLQMIFHGYCWIGGRLNVH